jgi:hypothetical protein
MNSLAWIGIIIWGIFLTGFGLGTIGPTNGIGTEVQVHDSIFLIAGGIVTCLMGAIGLLGFMGWIPGLRKEQKSCV